MECVYTDMYRHVCMLCVNVFVCILCVCVQRLFSLLKHLEKTQKSHFSKILSTNVLKSVEVNVSSWPQ